MNVQSVMRPTSHSEEIIVEGAPCPHGDYPHARLYGNLLFLSGVGPRYEASQYHRAFGAQCKQAVQNVATILAACRERFAKGPSATLGVSIVDVIVYLTDLKNIRYFNDVFRREFPNDLDVISHLEVAALPGGIDVELKVRAQILPKSAGDQDVGNLVFRSTGPSEEGGSLDFGAQCNEVFKRAAAELKRCGSDMSDVLDVEVYILDRHMKSANQWQTYNRAYDRVFCVPRPTRTSIGVKSLPHGWGIQLKTTATGTHVQTP